MISLSVNLNKVATVRNARGGHIPSVVDAARVAVDAGAQGITVHPRADARHVTRQDVYDLAALLGPIRDHVEFNIEGDPRPDLIRLVTELKPAQSTLVPVMPGEITSQAGWPPDTPQESLRGAIRAVKDAGVRVSLFVEADRAAIEWAAGLDVDRIELYTEPYARAFEAGGKALAASFARYEAAAIHAHALGLGVNAGHDLDLDNLVVFRELPHLAEVSIGHALVSRAIFEGLAPTVRAYLAVLEGRRAAE